MRRVRLGLVVLVALIGLQATAGEAAAAITAVGSVADTRLASSEGIAIQGRYAYVLSGSLSGTNRLNVIDIANPAVPVIVGSIQDATLLDAAEDIFVVGAYAYVTTEGGTYLTIVDVSNAASPVITGSVSSATALNETEDVFVSGRYAYVTSDPSDTFTIVDVGNPQAPFVVASITGTALNGAEGVHVVGNYAYVASEDYKGVAVIDVSNPTAPVIRGSVTNASLLDFASGIFVSGRYAYVSSAATSDRLVVVDVSNPASPTVTGSVSNALFNDLDNLYVAGNYAYVTSASTNSLVIVDVSSPTTPTVIDSITSSLLETPIGIVVDGRYAYTTNLTGTGRMSVFDIGGTTVQTLHAGEVRAGTLKAAQEVTIGNNLTVGGSLEVGRGGFLSNGPGAFNSYATTSLASVPTLSLNLTDSNSNSVVDVLSLSHAATSSSSNNIGTGLLFAAEDASGIATSTGRIASILTNTSTSSLRSELTFSTRTTSGALTEAMRISDDGFVGIGTSDPIAKLHIVNSTTAVPRGIVIGQHEDTNNSALLSFRKSLGSYESPAATPSGTNIGNLFAEAYDGTQYVSGGRLRFRVDGTVSTGVVPTAVQLFSGTGSGGGIERLTIASGAGGAANETNFNDPGNDWDFRVETDTDTHALFVDGASNSVGIGDSTPTEGKLTVGGTLYVLDNSLAGTAPLCWDGSGGSLHGACTSSEKYKTDIADYTRGLEDVLKLAPRSFSWKRNADGTLATSTWATTTPDVGFIAEEVAAVNPDFARFREDGAGDVNERSLLAATVNAIQELAARITELEDRIHTLEAKNADLEARLDASEK